MGIEIFEKGQQALQLRVKVHQAELERLNKAKTISVSEARKLLKKRIKGL